MKKELSIKKLVVILLCALLCVSTVSVTNADAAVRKVRRVKTTKKKKPKHTHEFQLYRTIKGNCSTKTTYIYKCANAECGATKTGQGGYERNIHVFGGRVRWNRSHTQYARWCTKCSKWIPVH